MEATDELNKSLSSPESLRAERIFKFLDAHNLILRRRFCFFAASLSIHHRSGCERDRQLIIVFKMKFMAI